MYGSRGRRSRTPYFEPYPSTFERPPTSRIFLHAIQGSNNSQGKTLVFNTSTTISSIHLTLNTYLPIRILVQGSAGIERGRHALHHFPCCCLWRGVCEAKAPLVLRYCRTVRARPGFPSLVGCLWLNVCISGLETSATEWIISTGLSLHC